MMCSDKNWGLELDLKEKNMKCLGTRDHVATNDLSQVANVHRVATRYDKLGVPHLGFVYLW